MRRSIPVLALAAAAIAAFGATSFACTTFCIDEGAALVFGKNYDWNVADCLVMVNPMGAAKIANVKTDAARWTSRYGSVTFNQYGREHPCGGINEAGLVVELMWLDETGYPGADGRLAVPTLQWIQYQLDNSATVADVIASNDDIRIQGRRGFIHFLVADTLGDVATIEFIGGKAVVHTGESMPYSVLTNDTYDNSLAYLGDHQGYGGSRRIPTSPGSLDRFARAVDRVENYDEKRDGDAVVYAFETLAKVAQGSSTQWSIVYDIPERRVYVRTVSNHAVRFLDLDDLDFSCESGVQIVDLQADYAGDLKGHLASYDTEHNFELMRSAFRQTRFLGEISESDIRILAGYPETITCENAGHSSR